MAEKTEKATPKKLRDARKKGQVAKSQDMTSAFTFIVSIVGILGFSSIAFTQLSQFLVSTFNMMSQQPLGTLLPQLFAESFYVIFYVSLPILVLVAFTGVLIEFLIVGPLFTFEVFKFDIKKFNPVQNLKAKFKLKTLVELLKSIAKISVAGWLVYGVMFESLPVLVKAVSMPISSALLIFNAFLVEVVMKVGLFFIVIAVLDFAYQKYNFGKEMRMEKFEVKQEYKNTEGDPHIKGKRKQIAQEIAYSDPPRAGVRQAAAVVTNPTHLAIAIGYDRELDAAPFITVKGKGETAQRMVKLAGEYGVPVIRNIKLAHELWNRGEEYDYVPEDTYEAIAEILRWIQSLKSDPELVHLKPAEN